MLIDTHKAIEKLIAVGNKKANAEAIVEIINSQEDSLATKGDILSIKKEMEVIDTKLEGKMNGLEKDINWLKALQIAILVLLIKVAFFN